MFACIRRPGKRDIHMHFYVILAPWYVSKRAFYMILTPGISQSLHILRYYRPLVCFKVCILHYYRALVCLKVYILQASGLASPSGATLEGLLDFQGTDS